MYPIEAEIDYRKLIFLGQLCHLPGGFRAKEIFIHRLIHINESPVKKLGFVPDIFRILNKYSIVQVLNEYIRTGSFPNKISWKKVVREKINALYIDEMRTRISSSESLPRIYKVHIGIPLHPHAFWVFCREYPRYKKYAHLAVRLIGLMFCGRWLSLCHKSGENSISLVEHILLFCPSNHNFRNVLWQKLIARFGFVFYISFISLPSSEQVNSLLSGFGTMLDKERDKVDSMKIFLSSLKFISLDNHENKITL